LPQVVHALSFFAVSVEKKPGPQFAQSADPGTTLNLPASQALHASLLAWITPRKPASHLQLVTTVLPAGLDAFSGQAEAFRTLIAPTTFEYVLFGNDTHAPEPLESLYFPGAH
jgi:hypothetical protein